MRDWIYAWLCCLKETKDYFELSTWVTRDGKQATLMHWPIPPRFGVAPKFSSVCQKYRSRSSGIRISLSYLSQQWLGVKCTTYKFFCQITSCINSDKAIESVYRLGSMATYSQFPPKREGNFPSTHMHMHSQAHSHSHTYIKSHILMHSWTVPGNWNMYRSAGINSFLLKGSFPSHTHIYSHTHTHTHTYSCTLTNCTKQLNS